MMSYTKKQIIIALIWTVIILISRIFTYQPTINNYDPASYYLAVIDYSIKNDRPHLPGYYLYVKTASLINHFTSNINLSLEITNLFLLCLAVFFTNLILNLYLKKETEKIAFNLILFFNPFVIYYSSVSEIYIVDLALASVLFFVGISEYYYYIPVILFLFGGFRQSSILLLLPLSVYLYYRGIRTYKIKSINVIFSACLAIFSFCIWFIPMINSCGGLLSYLHLYLTNNPYEKRTFFQNISVYSAFAIYIFSPFLFILPGFFNVEFRNKLFNKCSIKKVFETKYLSLLIWFIFPQLFFLFGQYTRAYAFIHIVPVYFFLVLILKNYKHYFIYSMLITALYMAFFFGVKPVQPEISVFQTFRKSDNGIVKRWFDKENTFYLMSNSKLKEIDKFNEAYYQFTSNNPKFKTFLFDNTVNRFSRPLQANFIFKNDTLISAITNDSLNYIVFTGLDNYIINRKDAKIENSVLITTKLIYYKFFKNIDNAEIYYDYVFILPDNTRNLDYLKIF